MGKVVWHLDVEYPYPSYVEVAKGLIVHQLKRNFI